MQVPPTHGPAYAVGNPHFVACAPTSFTPTKNNLHGKVIRDPYQWLEDVDSRETKAWIEAQNRISERWLENAPGRDRVRTRLKQLWDYDKYGVPQLIAGRLFYTKMTGLQNQPVFLCIAYHA